MWCSRERWPSAGRTRWTYKWHLCVLWTAQKHHSGISGSDVGYFLISRRRRGRGNGVGPAARYAVSAGPPGACETSSGGFRGDGAPDARDETLSVLAPNTTGQRTEGFAPLLAIDFPNPYSGASMLRGIILFEALYLLSESRLVRIGLVVVLSGLARSRIDPALHWASDAVGGALLGVEALL